MHYTNNILLTAVCRTCCFYCR